MSSSSRGGLRFHDIEVGDELPTITHVVTASTVVLGAMAARDVAPVHHDPAAARARGIADIFLDQPTQAAWLERLISDWSGPAARLARLAFAMRAPIVPGDEMTITGVVRSTSLDDAAHGWVELDLTIVVGDHPRTTGSARVAIPVDDDDNPWTRRGTNWTP